MTRTMLKIAPDRLASPSFSRGSTAGYWDVNGARQLAAVNVVRDAHYEQGLRTILIEGGSSNLVPNTNGRPNTVTPSGTTPPTVSVISEVTPFGTEAYQVTFPTGAPANSNCAAVTDGFTMQFDGTSYAATVWIAGSIANVHIEWTGTAGIAPLVATGRTLGAYAEYRLVNSRTGGGGGTEKLFFWPSVVPAAPVTFRIGPVQFEHAGFASSLMLGSPAPVARSSDVIGWTIPDAPHAMEWTVEFFEHGRAFLDQSYVASLGADSGTGALLRLVSFGGGYEFLHNNGTASVASGANVRPAIGDRVKLRAIVYADGSTQVFQSINGGGEVASTRSAANPFAQAWGGQTFRLNSLGLLSPGNAAYLSATLTDTRDFPALAIDGVDARTAYGFALDTASGWRDAPAVQRQTQPIPGRAGATLVGLEQEQPRALRLSGTVIGSDAGDARAKLDAFVAALRRGDLPLTFADLGSRQLTAALDGLTVTPGAASMLARKLAVDVALTCLDPYAHDVDAFALALSSTPTPLPLGTAPVRPVVTCTATAACTNPTLTLTDADGNTVATLTLTVALVAGDVLVIDCDAMTIALNGASRLDVLTSGDFLVLDVASQGDFSAAAWPSVAITFATGTPATAVCSYARAWRC